MINIACISKARFFEVQKTLLFPVVNRFYKMLREKIYEGCSNAVTNHFSGNGRCDSPGYSAKYGTYSLMNTEMNMVIDFQVVHVSQVDNSNQMGKYHQSLWCCCSSCDGDSEVLTEKWLSILYHIRGIHSREGEKNFHKSEHGPLEKE